MENKEKIRKIQEIVYEILCDVDDFCRENHIRYYLSGGTCLGAVRHQGFIPWDDDADIMLPREDYNKFLETFPQAFAGKYGVGALSLNPKWEKTYARVWNLKTIRRSKYFDLQDMGVYVDVFPIDGLPKTKTGRKLFYPHIKVLSELGKEANRVQFKPENRFHVLRKVAGVFARPLGTRFFSERITSIAEKYPFDTSEFVACSMPVHYGSRETIRREKMEKAEYLPFKGRRFPVPVGYDVYLRNLYGDYMIVPKGAEENGYKYIEYWDIDFGEEEDEK